MQATLSTMPEPCHSDRATGAPRNAAHMRMIVLSSRTTDEAVSALHVHHQDAESCEKRRDKAQGARMTKRKTRSSAGTTSKPIASSASLSALERQVVAIAEQLGRLAASAQSHTDNWLDAPTFHSQLTRIRDRASALLARLNQGTSGNGDVTSRSRARERSRAKVSAPGKKHRRAPEPAPGVKHSDERLTKALATSRRKTARPRQG